MEVRIEKNVQALDQGIVAKNDTDLKRNQAAKVERLGMLILREVLCHIGEPTILNL